MRHVVARHENWPLKEQFKISRSQKTSVDVVVVEISEGEEVGRGESIPYARYEQNVEQTLDTISDLTEDLINGLEIRGLQSKLEPGAARNAVDCALWDLEAKQTGVRVWERAQLTKPAPVLGVYSLSMERPTEMAKSARNIKYYPILKLKLGSEDVIKCVSAVRAARPDCRIIVDANEAWTVEMLQTYVPQLANLGVELIEQPLPADDDAELENLSFDLPICADESFHTESDLNGLLGRYDMFNIKLDKTGGFTEALKIIGRVQKEGRPFMIGSMIATSLSLAPAVLLCANASYVDLDSSVWLRADRTGGVEFRDGWVSPADTSLWG